MSGQTKTLVENYLNFFKESQRNPAVLKEILSEKFHFKSPLGEFFTADSFIHDLKRDVLAIGQINVHQIIADQNKACALYEIKSNDPDIGTLKFSEWFQIDQGKIASIESTYDATDVRKSMTQI